MFGKLVNFHADMLVHLLQLRWAKERLNFTGTVTEVDPTRAPFSKHVQYMEDDDDEWGFFRKGVFHTSEKDHRTVKGVTLPSAMEPVLIQESATTKPPPSVPPPLSPQKVRVSVPPPVTESSPPPALFPGVSSSGGAQDRTSSPAPPSPTRDDPASDSEAAQTREVMSVAVGLNPGRSRATGSRSLSGSQAPSASARADHALQSDVSDAAADAAPVRKRTGITLPTSITKKRSNSRQAATLAVSEATILVKVESLVLEEDPPIGSILKV